MKIKLINIQGLTKVKSLEVEELLKEKRNECCILCLVETQQKYKKVDFSKGVICVEKMRDMNDKKGGGLSVFMNERDGCDIKEKECDNADILKVEVKVRNTVIIMLLTYIDVSDRTRNGKIITKIDEELEKVQDEQLVILLGDFDGHLGFIGPQPLNYNGKEVLDIMDKWNMILLNGDLKCEGEITRRQGNIGSAIDFILVNETMYKYFETVYR